jgi:hypothetical protein
MLGSKQSNVKNSLICPSWLFQVQQCLIKSEIGEAGDYPFQQTQMAEILKLEI